MFEWELATDVRSVRGTLWTSLYVLADDISNTLAVPLAVLLSQQLRMHKAHVVCLLVAALRWILGDQIAYEARQ